MKNEPCQNEDRQLWQESDENGHRSLHVTKGGGIGINVGGNVWVMPLAKWHKLAVDSEASPTPAYLVEKDKQMKAALGYCEDMAKQIDALKQELSRFTPTPSKVTDKPTAPVGLVEELTTLIETEPVKKGDTWRWKVIKILSKYPATPEQKEK